MRPLITPCPDFDAGTPNDMTGEYPRECPYVWVCMVCRHIGPRDCCGPTFKAATESLTWQDGRVFGAVPYTEKSPPHPAKRGPGD